MQMSPENAFKNYQKLPKMPPTSIPVMLEEEPTVSQKYSFSPFAKGMVYISIGTAGILTPQCMSVGTVTSYVPIVNVRPGSPIIEGYLIGDPAAKDISRIREILSISISEIASTLKVSRQTIYGWINGGPISKGNSYNLAQLASVANVFKDANVAVTPYALRRRFNGEPPILQTLANGGNAVGAAQALIETLRTETQQQRLMTKRLEGRSSNASVDLNSNQEPSEENA